ncbi:MAG: cache domain-containing protein [Bacteroidota bacterium]|nr:cache domain-containing protein [Bacteroidota bacterium]
MKDLTSKSRQNFFTIITVVGLLVIFSFYFFIYVPRQEQRLQQNNFRILTRIAGNVKDRVDEYRQYINDRARISISYAPLLYKINPKDTSVFKNAYTKVLSQYFLESRPELELIYFCPVSADPDAVLIQNKLDNIVKPWFHFVRDTCSFGGERFEYGFTLNTASIEVLLHDAAFENCFLQRNGKIIAGPGTGVLAGEQDSLLVSSNGIKTGRVFSQEISGSTKKVFVQPFSLGNEENFVLYGYIDRDDYQKKTRNLSATMILVILLILFLLALSLPFVKLLLMSRNERLGISDAFFAGITVILGTSVVVLILLDVYTYFIPAKETRMQQLTGLSEEIHTNFQKEVSAICRQLDVYDSLISTDQSGIFTQNIVSLRDLAVVEEKRNNKVQVPFLKATSFPAQIIRPVYYENFTQVFWADSIGNQLFKWSTGPATTPMIRLDERGYFKNIFQNKVWTLPGSDAKEFYLEGIYSWTTGENMAVIAKKSNQRVVIYSGPDQKPAETQTSMIAMITELSSVMDPILTMSNGYCIMDNEGKVIFHSVKSKNLNENFLDECSASEEMLSAMYSRAPAFISTTYQEGNYKMYIRPLNNLPFYLVTFQDNLYPVTSNTEVLTLSVLLVVFFFLFICIQVIVLHFITAKDRMLKGKTFSFGWLWPLKEKKAAYQHILVFLIPAFVLLMFFLRKAGPVETLLMFFASSIFIFSFVYLKMDQFREDGSRKKIKEFISTDNIQILIAGLMMLVVLNIVSSYLIDNSIRFSGFQVILCTLSVALLWLNIPVLKTFSYRRCYLVLLVGILMLVSIIPTFAFFRISFEKVSEIRIRHAQLELAAEINRKSDGLNKSYHIGDSLQKDIYSGSFYHTKVSRLKSKGMAGKTNSVSAEEEVFSRISVSLTPSYNDVVKKEHNLAAAALDGSWKWKKTKSDTMELYYFDLQRSAVPGVDSLLIKSVIPAYKLPLPFGAQGFGIRGTLFWIVIVFSMIGLYAFIRFFVRIIFTTDFFRNNLYRKSAITSLDGYFNTTNVFLVGAPFSGKTTWLKNKYITDKPKCHINLGSIRTLEDVTKQLEKCTEANIIVIDHFEYGVRDFGIVGTRLLFFEGLKQLENKRILVASNIHPRLFLREYPEAPEKKEEEKDKNGRTESRSFDIDRWTRILGGYHKIYFPACGIIEKDADKPAQDVIDRECNNSYFLRAQKEVIRETLGNEHSDHQLTEEEIILRIESLAHVYYNSIWASLSEEEQYILYDIAQDGLVNLKNREVLTMLLNKGLLVYENRFRMMNESFRNFVLSEVSADDALELERKVKETGSWNYFRTPVVIILITIALFIFITQEETFNSIIAFITTFAVAIPIIFRLLGMITSMKGAKAG